MISGQDLKRTVAPIAAAREPVTLQKAGQDMLMQQYFTQSFGKLDPFVSGDDAANKAARKPAAFQRLKSSLELDS